MSRKRAPLGLLVTCFALILLSILPLSFTERPLWMHTCYASPPCSFDYMRDRDVDGADLALLATIYSAGTSDLSFFATEFGEPGCSQGSPPQLTNLVAPSTIVLGNPVTVEFDYADLDADIVFVDITVSNVLGNDSSTFEAALLKISGTSGHGAVVLKTGELPFGPTDFTMQLIDAAGLGSDLMPFNTTLVGESSGGSAPGLSDLNTVTPVQNRPTGPYDTVRAYFTFSYSDPDEDIDRLRVRLTSPNSEVALMEKPASSCCPLSVGDATQSLISFRASSGLGTYDVELTLFDRNGNVGNTVSVSVELVEAGGASCVSISDCSPTEGPSWTQVVLNGTGFASQQIENYLVELNEMPCEVVAVTDTKLTILIPEGAETGAFSVRVGDSMAWSPGAFVIPGAITLTPSSTNLVVGGTMAFEKLAVSAPNDDDTVVWYVDGIHGGDAVVGAITSDGVYTAPSEIPSGRDVTVEAKFVADPSVAGHSTVTILPPLSLPGEGRILAITGGTVKSKDRRASADVPPGALSESIVITVEALSGPVLPSPPEGKRVVGGATFGPDGTVFNHPVSILLPLIRFYPMGTQLNVMAYRPGTGSYLDEGVIATVTETGCHAAADIFHFSTYVAVDEAPEPLPSSSPEVVDATPGSGLLEGTKVPVLLTGNHLTADLQVDVFLNGNPNLEHIIPGALYTLGDRAGLLLDIQKIGDLSESDDLRTYTIRLKRFGSPPGEQETTFDISVQGLNEFTLPEGETLSLADPGEWLYSQVSIAGTLAITSGGIRIRSTGPVEISGKIDAKGKDGASAEDQAGATGGQHGGDGGLGREDLDCLFGFYCPEPENYGRNGNDCMGFPEFPEQGFCRPLTGSGKTVPEGLGGAAGVNIGFDPTDIFGLGSCTFGPVPPCIAAVIAIIDAAVSVADIADGGVTGKRGFGAVLISDQDETGGGGGGGGGRVALGVFGYFPGGGGGSGGDGGRDVSIVTPDEIILFDQGEITTEGGSGGNGSDTTLFPLPLPGNPLVPVPALPGGGGGGGCGGYLEISSGAQIAAVSESRQIRFGGGPGGIGGVTIVDPVNGNMRTAFRASYASNGPTISPGRCDPTLSVGSGSPIFDPATIDTMVTNRSLFRIRVAATGTTIQVLVEGNGGERAFFELPGGTHHEGYILLYQGFNTVSVVGMEDDLLKKRVLVLAVDTDGDGLSDADEAVLGTDAEHPDSDRDGLNDGDEIVHHGTDPLDRDSDHDGLSDFQEVTDTGTDPNDPDMDDDGFKDSLEVFLGSSPFNEYDTPAQIPEGTMYATGTNINGAFLTLLDPYTGAVGLAGQPGGLFSFGLALRRGALYTANGFTLSRHNPLLDVTTDVASFQDSVGDPILIRHIAYNRPENTLYGVELGPEPTYLPTGQLVQINTYNAVATRIGMPLDYSIHSMVFTNEGLLFAALEGDDTSDLFVKLDPATGAVVDPIGLIGGTPVFGMAFLETGELIASNRISNDTSELLTIDISTGAGTYLSTVAMAVFDMATPYGCVPRLDDSCAGAWSCPKLIAAGGYSPAMAIDGADSVHICHAHSGSGYWGDFNSLTLRYWQSTDLCATEFIEDSVGKGYYSAMAVDESNDDLHVSYGPAGLSYAKKEAATGLWTPTMVDEESGEGTSIAVDQSGNIHISSFIRGWGEGPDQVIYTTNASGTWEFTTIDDDAYFYEGSGPSMVVDTGEKVHIVYYEGVTQDLMYATNASGAWVVSTIDSDGMVGLNPGLAIDTDDKLHVSYLDVSNSELQYATNQDVFPGSGNCSAGSDWNCEVVGSGNGDTSIATDTAGGVHIGYSNFNLSDAKRDPLTKTWSTSPVVSTGSWQLKINDISIAIDSSGKAHMVYTVVDYRYDGTPYEADLYYVREKE